ncbi:acyl-CoA-binding domain-containing protein 4 isoform X1 [Mauremys reevesii]|uniref:acyl-CoA-binding domain-containing protein 4 isoform X1 n=1 Tax=Mauremys reevesii TaxID=260615 RepID=UPI00193FE6E3|nr:acyl-CoA-binding domain-containing protein 4 isoform X1 [Mauremys reevesii]XP_039360247.1 acyl-CoA-binding domain-containing protein 4 isoform X1 [Mauremys reevesii]XP_039360248.1 acyl-CoA-binding domain-containing protein 4 isoform X1 [Mauremys reevesii]
MGMEPVEPDYQKQFQAAVRVIQGLPKNGSYRPPYEVMLRFYSYYKQATVGSCEIPRPGFWDPIGRYKWDAWNRLGKMSKEEAMAAYISEMKKVAQKVIDTIPAGEMSEDVFGFFEPLYEVIHDMPRPPESFFKKKAGAGPGQADEAPESSQVTSDSESEGYSDTLEQMEPGQAGQRVAGQSLSLSSPHTAGLCADAGRESPARGGAELGEGGEPVGRSSDGPRPLGTERELQAAPGARGCPDADQGDTASAGLRPELDVQLLGTVRALQDNMRSVLKRLSHLETLSTAQGHESGSGPRPPLAALGTQKPSRWPLEVSARTLLFLLAWPFVVQWLLRRFQRRKRGLFPV